MATLTSTFATLVTPAPNVGRAIKGGDFLGYYIGAASTQTLSCGTDQAFTTSGRYGGCYGTDYLSSVTTLNTGCTPILTASGNQIGGIVTCTPGTAAAFWSCVTQTISQTLGETNASPFTNYFCGNNYNAVTIYRDIPSGAATTSSKRSASSSVSTSSSTTASSSTSTSPTPTQTPSPKAAASQAWIAGPVLGSIALIAFVAFAVWFILNRRKERRNAQDHRVSYNSVAQQEEHKHVYPMGAMGSSPQRSELDTMDYIPRRSEMP